MSLDLFLRRPVGAPLAPSLGYMYGAIEESEEVFDRNITHNLGRMAREAGIYECMWRPEEIGASTAGDVVERLEEGLAALVSDPDRFRQFNPENGWGSYEGLVEFATEYLEACRESPDALIIAYR